MGRVAYESSLGGHGGRRARSVTWPRSVLMRSQRCEPIRVVAGTAGSSVRWSERSTPSCRAACLMTRGLFTDLWSNVLAMSVASFAAVTANLVGSLPENVVLGLFAGSPLRIGFIYAGTTREDRGRLVRTPHGAAVLRLRAESVDRRSFTGRDSEAGRESPRAQRSLGVTVRGPGRPACLVPVV